MRKLEEWGWHYEIHREIRLYIECSKSGSKIVNIDNTNPRTAFEYLHNELNEQLFRYQDAVNTAVRYDEYNFSLRKKLVMFLGCRCIFCGNEDIDYLQLDHKSNSQGGLERSRFKRKGIGLMAYYWNNLIDAFLRLQVLCIKCHRAKSTYKITQKDIEEKVKQDVSQLIKPGMVKKK